MLELSKEILEKVSFDKLLFRKELKKAMRWLSKEELEQFRLWCLSRFYTIYPDVLKEVLIKN